MSIKTSHFSVSYHCRRTHDKNGLKGLSMSSQLLIWVIYERENIASLCEFSLQENSYEDMRNIFSLEIMRNSYGNHSWKNIWGHENLFTRGAQWEIMPWINSYEDMRNPLFHEKIWELIWKSFMRNHMRICEIVYSWCAMRNHAQENSYEDIRNPTFHEKVWEVI